MDNYQPILWVNGANGQYVPQIFVNLTELSQVKNLSEEECAILRFGPEAEEYWDVWESALNNIQLVAEDCMVYFLHQSDEGDLWLIPEGMEWNEETDWWSWKVLKIGDFKS